MQVDGVTLTNSRLPNVGFVQFKYGGANKKVCSNTLNKKATFVICRQLGYEKQKPIAKKPPPSGNKDGIFTGSIQCSGKEKYLSKCSITKKAKSCSQLSYLRCAICPRPLLEDKQRFPDSSFTASNSSEGHSPSNARKSSGSSWCAPDADGKQYLQLDLRRLYVIYRFTTFGDSSSAKWVKTYKLNYTDDLINWKPVWEKNITGNKQAYNDASITRFKGGTTIRALRFIPLTYVGQPCMRIEICGGTRFPDKPTKLTVTNIKSTSAEISWAYPKNTGDYQASAAVLSGFFIKLKIGNCLIVNITTKKVNKRKLTNLSPYTTYEISVAAGNKRGGFGEETTTSFRTKITSGTAFGKVNGVSLLNSSPPNEGFVQIKYGGTKTVCWQSLKNKADNVICRQLGYTKQDSLVKKAPPSNNKDPIFSGSINCNGKEKNLSQCTITNSTSTCSELSYIKCFICNRPLIRDKRRFPDSSFTASASSESHSPSDARISSGSSWCAPAADGKHYLEVDLGRLYVIYRFATFGDSSCSKWVTTYKLNYTVDLINWKPVRKKKIRGNKNAYNDATNTYLRGGLTTRALRFIPLTYVGQPCMRFEICGGTRFPDKPTNLTVTNITSGSAEISWADPKNTGDYKVSAAVLTRFFIQLKKDNSLIRNITTDKANKRKLTNLTPNATYEISVAAGNQNGFGEETITSFTTLGKALLPDKPSKLTVTNITSESAGISWVDPANEGNNGLTGFQIKLTKDNAVILNITINKVNKYEIDNLTPNTTYEISVAAGNQNGFGETTITSFRTSEATSVTTFEKVDGVSLSYSSLPAEGFVQIKYGGTKNVCWRSLKNKAKYVVCRQLGYLRLASLVKKAPSSDNKDASFSGKINCAGGVKNLSQCLITNSTTTCSELSYIKCSVCPRPLLGDKQRFPDSSFTASASSQSRSPSDARTSSGSSWCAPAADGKHYLQVDLGRRYVIYRFATFGDSTSPKWVTTYKLNYTVDLINWKPVWKKKIRGNKNAYNDATNAYFHGGITTRALRFIPLTYVGQPCMRIEICGGTWFPDKPTNLTFTNITSRSADISWVDPENTGDNKGVAVLSGFFIKLKKGNSLIRNITTDKVNKRKLTNLTPNTTYQISVAAGNQNGFGEETITSFTTLGKALLPDKPSKLTVINITSESAGISWVDPANGGKNGLTGFRIKLTKDNTVILNITINKVNKYEIDNLTPNTTYEISVAAGNQNGFGEETITSFTTLGKALLPDKPSKLTVTNITSESAGISWADPVNGGNNSLTRFRIKLTKDNTVILNITINKVNKYEIDNLTPNTTYEISVAAGNQNGFGETTITSFRTSEATSVTTFEKVDGVSLSYSSLPAEGFVQIKYGGTKNVCWRSLKNKAKYVVCRQLGYLRLASLVKKAPSSDNKDASFSGKINCAGGVKNLSQCLITNSTTTCSELSYIKCSVCPRPLLGDKQRFPDSSFTASASSQSRSPSDARTSSGSSWCAPAADGKHYLQVDLGRLYVIYRFATFGDSTSPKWVTTYKLNYTVDLINWKPVWKKKIRGNKNAYNDATNAYFRGGITTRALRFIPLTYVGQPCMRIEICGATRFPDKPTNLTFTNITSRSADISWVDPENTGDNKGVAVLSGFFIKLKKENSLIRNITTDKVNKRKLTNLTPNTTYQISVAAGNQNGFGEETTTSFTTLGK
ncbi:Receptor-type tyrosine- phosphatase F, partial [Paramuricea clavata]